MSEPNPVAVVVISEELARGIRAYLGGRPYEEVYGLIARLERESSTLTEQVLSRLQEREGHDKEA